MLKNPGKFNLELSLNLTNYQGNFTQHPLELISNKMSNNISFQFAAKQEISPGSYLLRFAINGYGSESPKY
jgi:hypothetical protein